MRSSLEHQYCVATYHKSRVHYKFVFYMGWSTNSQSFRLKEWLKHTLRAQSSREARRTLIVCWKRTMIGPAPSFLIGRGQRQAGESISVVGLWMPAQACEQGMLLLASFRSDLSASLRTRPAYTGTFALYPDLVVISKTTL